MLDLPPEIIVLALSDCNIHQVHNFQLVCRATNEIIQSHSASVYRALAIHYGLAHKDEDWEGIVKSRRVYFDWLKEPRGHDGDENQEERRMLVGGWKEYGMEVPQFRVFATYLIFWGDSETSLYAGEELEGGTMRAIASL